MASKCSGRSTLRRIDRQRLFGLLPTVDRAITSAQLLRIAGLPDDHKKSVNSALQQWKACGAAQMQGRPGSPGLWSRLWTAQQLADWITEGRAHGHGGKRVAAVLPPEPTDTAPLVDLSPAHALASLCQLTGVAR